MKHLSKHLLTAALALSSAAAFAQNESIDLGITGKVVPAACTPNLSSTSLDWGDVPFGSERAKPLPQKSLTVSVACQTPTRFALQIVDNHPDSIPSDALAGSRGLGLSDGTPVGTYRLRLSNYVDLPADGKRVYAVLSRDKGENWKTYAFYGSNYQIRTDDYLGFAEGHPSIPAAIQNMSFEIHASGALLPGSELPAEQFNFAGSSTFTLRYL